MRETTMRVMALMVLLTLLGPAAPAPTGAAPAAPQDVGVYEEDFAAYTYEDYVENAEWDIWSQALRMARTDGIEQYQPAVAVDESGYAFVVWEDGYSNISAQRLDPFGRRVWETDVRVNADDNIVNPGDPDIAIDPSGNAIVVWRDQRDGDYDIYAQKVTPTGDRLWVADVEVSSDDGLESQWSPAVAFDGAGNALVVWEDDYIYAQKMDSNGNKLWPTVLRVSDTSGDYPDLDIDQEGNAVVVWWYCSDSQPDIYAQWLGPSGNKLWSGDVQVNAEPGDSDVWPVKPAVAVDSSGNAFVVWNGGHIYVQRLGTSGNLLWANNVRVDYDAGSLQWNPTVAIDSSNHAIIVWNNWNYVYAQKLDQGGARIWASDIRVPTNQKLTDRGSPSIGVDEYGQVIITWWERGNSDIYAQKLDANGAWLWGSDVRVNFDSGTAIQRGNVVVTDQEDKSFVVWQDSRNGSADVYVRRIDADGNRLWDADVRVNATIDTVQQEVRYTAIDATLDTNGDLVVVWGDIRNDTGDIYAQKLDVNGNRLWLTDVRLNSDSEGRCQRCPAVASDSTGNTVVAWSDHRSGDGDTGDIYAQKLNSAGSRLWPADVRVNSDVGIAGQGGSELDIDSNGNIIIAWEDSRNKPHNSDVYAQKLTSGGSKVWTGDLQVNVNSDAITPAVAVDASGNAIIAWHNYESSCELFAQKLNPSGARLWGNGIIVNSETAYAESPSIAIDGSGNTCIVWWDYRRGDGDIYAQRLSAAGSKLWLDDVRVNSVANSGAWRASLDLDTGSNLLIAWADRRSANDDVYVQRLSLDGEKLWPSDMPIVFADFFYLANGIAQSREVDTTDDLITEATLTAQYILQGGSTAFYFTNDGGQHWAEVTPGVTHVFTTTGSDLRWRVEMASNPVWRDRAPIIEQLRIEYETTSAEGDDYEPDDICVQAQPIQVNGVAQRHTFHQYEDSDWVWFEAQAGTTYIIQTSNTGSRADTVLELCDQCGQPPTDFDDNLFGPGASISFDAPTSGTYYVRVLQHDGSVYGADTDYDLSVRTPQSTGAAIIVAGRLRESDAVQPIINATANLAYQTLLASGFSADDIRYLNSDLGQPGVDDVPSEANVRDAIQDWARTRVGLGTPLWLYLADHGNVDRFHNEVGEVVTASELDLWLSNLEATSGVDQINVILDACFSGSFIDTHQSGSYGLNEISGHGRLVAASTTSRWWAYAPRIVAGQPTPLMYFSDGFWHALGQGQSVWDAFLAGRATVDAGGVGRCGDYAYTCQRPWLDDTGDAWFDSSDGQAAQSRGLAATFGGGATPYTDWVQVGEVSDGQATIQAQVRDDGSVERVWARVFAPSFTLPESEDGSVPVIEVPEEELASTGSDVFALDYDGFTEEGVYQVVVYAMDEEGNTASPKWVLVGEKKVYLPLVLRGW